MKQLEADIIVVACGISGLAATISAAEKGAKVITFEKSSSAGGAGKMGTGLFAVESRLQRERQMTLTREQAFKKFMEFTHWRGDAKLIKAYIDKSADTIHWLEKFGVEFVEPAAYFPGSEFTWHLVKPKDGFFPGRATTSTMIKILVKKAKEYGAQIYFETPVKKLLIKDATATGVIAETQTGEQIVAKSKAVIIATGGYGDNTEMIKKYTGFEHGKDIFSYRIPGINGDGLRMAWEAGAAQTESSMEMTFGIPGEKIYGYRVRAVFRQPNLLVNIFGERFINEEIIMNTPFAGNAISRQKDRLAVMIFDETILEHYEKDGFDLPMSLVFNVPFVERDLLSEIEKAIKRGIKDIIIADSIDELAEKTGINPKGLKETIKEYNKYCEGGCDCLFNKERKYLIPIRGAKYYAGKNYPAGFGTLGGIRINYKTEVLNKEWEKIPGLYAAGSDTCSIFGDTYPFIFPGSTMGYAMNTGRIAGENASIFCNKSNWNRK